MRPEGVARVVLEKDDDVGLVLGALDTSRAYHAEHSSDQYSWGWNGISDMAIGAIHRACGAPHADGKLALEGGELELAVTKIEMADALKIYADTFEEKSEESVALLGMARSLG